MSIKSVTLSLNGQSYTLTLDSSTGKYQKSITAPNATSYGETDHKYAMQLKVEDMAGNVTAIDKTHSEFGTQMMLRVLEKTPPEISITKPSAGSYVTSNSVTIEFQVTDAESGVDPDTIALQIDSGSKITSGLTKTAVTNGYKCTYTATVQNGDHTIKISAEDNDGNATGEKTAAFTVDTVPPELNITSPAVSLITNAQSLTVSGSTNESCTITIKLNGSDQGTVTLSSEKTFSKTISLTKGTNTIVITATDNTGKTTSVTREVTYDPTAPVIVSIDVSPNPVDAGGTFVVTVEATDE